ncbi:Holliday junction branch migration protein RuvA [Corynebacterium sp. ZY180755]
MIASLRGTVITISLDSAVIECAGVGYLVKAAPNTLAQLARGEETFILTTMVVKEDSQTLYGFLDDSTREMFALLQTVSGLGPRLALAAQSVYTTQELAGAISSSDAKTLQKIPGVGKRMAERMVVDLKDKVAGYVSPGGSTHEVASPQVDLSGHIAEQVIEALTGLGFTEKMAEPAVSQVLSENPDIQTSQALRAALSILGTRK